MQRVILVSLLSVMGLILVRPAQTQGAPTMTRRQMGEQVFINNCSGCHSVAPGRTLVGPSLAGEMKGASPGKADARVRTIILNGKGKMPPQRAQLSDKDLNSLIAYLRTLE